MDELKEIPEVYKILDDTKKSQIKEDNDCGFEFSNKIIDNNDNNSNIKIESKKERKKETLFKDGDVDIDWDDI